LAAKAITAPPGLWDRDNAGDEEEDPDEHVHVPDRGQAGMKIRNDRPSGLARPELRNAAQPESTPGEFLEIKDRP
jgi:hypothetical protein